jgi:hypothetical protein
VQRARLLAVTAGIVALLAAAGPAAAFSPPELFVRAQSWDTHEAVGDWIPLASEPALQYLGGYQIGFRMQDSGEPANRQTVAMTIPDVPDGRPSQPHNAAPYCVIRSGDPGSIQEVAPELQFEGDGAYTVKVAIGPGNAGRDGCLGGPATTGVFDVVARVVPRLVGSPMSFRAGSSRNPFDGVQADDPPGGQADIRCALDATVQPDGSLTGAVVIPRGTDHAHPSLGERSFPLPGVWTCAARATAEGLDDASARVLLAGSWSAPLTFDVRSDFRRRSGRLDRPRSRRPRFTFTAENPAEAAGGKVTITLFRVTGCRDRDYRLLRVGRYRGSFGASSARVALERPAKRGFYLGRFAFAGTRFLRAGSDPVPIYLVANRRSFGFARTFARCPGYIPAS